MPDLTHHVEVISTILNGASIVCAWALGTIALRRGLASNPKEIWYFRMLGFEAPFSLLVIACAVIPDLHSAFPLFLSHAWVQITIGAGASLLHVSDTFRK